MAERPRRRDVPLLRCCSADFLALQKFGHHDRVSAGGGIVSIEAEFRSAVLALVPELVAMVRAELGRPRLLPIRQTPIAYRAILAAERAGELAVYRVGHASLVDEVELYDWVRRTGAKRTNEPAPDPVDEIGALVEAGDRRRRGRGGRAA